MRVCKRCGKEHETLRDNGLCNVCYSRMIDGLHRLLDFNPVHILGFSEPLKYHYDDDIEYGDVPQRQDDGRGDEMTEELNILWYKSIEKY